MQLAMRTAACGLALSFSSATLANTVSAYWFGPIAGDWSVASNWLPPVVPHNSDTTEFGVVVDVLGGQLSLAIVDEPFVIKTLFVEIGDTVRIKDGSSLRLTSGYLKNRGTVVIDGEEDVTELILDGFPNLDMTGTLRLDGTGFARLRAGATSAAVFNGIQHTVRGNGTIDAKGAGFLNTGTVIAGATAAPHGALTIEFAPLDQLVNAGVMRAAFGNLVINGGTVINAGILIIDSNHALTRDGTMTHFAGELRVEGATAPTLAISATGGTITGGGVIAGELTCEATTIAPAGEGATGTLTIGALSCTAQTSLELEFSPLGHDAVHVLGDAQLGGAVIRITLIAGGVPDPESDYFVMTVDGAIVGDLPSVVSCPSAEIVATAHGISLHFAAMSGIVGDLDGDGVVTAADLTLLIGHWGVCERGCCAGDIDGNGVIDSEDLAALLAAWAD